MTNVNAQLKDKSGNVIYPKTLGSIVLNNNGDSLGGVEAGAQVNVISTVKVNGSSLTPDANKAVDVSVPSYTIVQQQTADTGDAYTYYLASGGSAVTGADKIHVPTGGGSASDFTGADGTNAGIHGLVPAPTATDNTKFLKGDGTWGAVPSTTNNVTNNSTDALTSGGAYTNLVRRLSTSSATGSASQGVYIDANGQVQACTAVVSTYSSSGTAPVDGTAISAGITAECGNNGTITTAISSAITAGLANGGDIATAISNAITTACASGGAIYTLINNLIDARTEDTGETVTIDVPDSQE